jgi:hypothetical protein
MNQSSAIAASLIIDRGRDEYSGPKHRERERAG